MSRSFTILIALIILITAFLMYRHFQPNTTSEGDLPLEPSQAAPSLASQTDFQDWREFSSSAKGFKVLLPSLPQHVADKTPDPKSGEVRQYDSYLAADDRGAAFMISTITSERAVEGEAAEERLKQAITDILARNKENKLGDMKQGKFKQWRAIDFVINGNDLTIAGKVFAVGKTVYVLSMIDKNVLFNPQVLAFFINSFDLSNGSAKP